MADSTPPAVYPLIDRLRQLDGERAALRGQIARAMDEAAADEAGRSALAVAPLRVRRPGAGRPGQTPDGRSLIQLLEVLLDGRTMGVKELVLAARGAGYVTKAKHFRCIVSSTLAEHPRRFVRVSYGRYTAVKRNPAPGAAEAAEQLAATG